VTGDTNAWIGCLRFILIQRRFKMTETYYYMWEFFTSITILALIAIYIVHDRRQNKKSREETTPQKKDKNHIQPEKK